MDVTVRAVGDGWREVLDFLQLAKRNIEINSNIPSLLVEVVKLLVDATSRSIKVRCVERDGDIVSAVGAYDVGVSLELPNVMRHRMQALRTFYVNSEAV